jgi:hypothetical protein
MICRSPPHRRLARRPDRISVTPQGARCGLALISVLLALLGDPLDASGQYENIVLPVDTIERLLRYEDYEIASFRDNRQPGDRTQIAVLAYPGYMPLRVKWAAAPRGGDSFNNRPRYEIAVYELQKLFLDEEDYVVPPTVARVVPLDEYPREGAVLTTFSGIDGVVILMQYWLSNVSGEDVYDEDRLESDSVYARHLADMNILTYLVRHADAGPGNLLISTVAASPRVFAVDNGVTFGEISNRPDDWQRLRVDRLPRRTVERLRGISEEDLQRALGVLVQFEVRGGQLVQVEPTGNLSPGDGVYSRNGEVQLGLTSGEIESVYRRLESLLEDVDEGKVGIF